MFSKTTHTIINGDSRQMNELKDKSVHLIVTSLKIGLTDEKLKFRYQKIQI
jgi:hypothetical protein